MTNTNLRHRNQLHDPSRPCIWQRIGEYARTGIASEYMLWRSECGCDQAYWPENGRCGCGRKVEEMVACQ